MCGDKITLTTTIMIISICVYKQMCKGIIMPMNRLEEACSVAMAWTSTVFWFGR